MFKTFSVSFRLRNTYKTNSIIYSLKAIPLIRRLLPASLYASHGLKTFANVISAIFEFGSIFIGKLLYLLCLYLATQIMTAPTANSFLHMLLFLSLAGGFLNTNIFNPTRDKFYAINIMRMDARRYALVNYAYFLLKMLIGFLPFTLLFGLLCGVNTLSCLLTPLLVIELKLCFTALSLRQCRSEDKIVNENKIAPIKWAFIIALVLAAAAPPYWGYAVNGQLFCLVVAALLIPAAFALRYIVRFDAYRIIYKALLIPNNYTSRSARASSGAAQQMAMQKKISSDLSQSSNKSGYKYFNEIFMKRHAKLLTRSAKRITAICTAAIVAIIAACMLSPTASIAVNQMTLTFLPYFLFVMYLINRGAVITRAMFLNCDHSMLAYRFYRQSKAVLALFVERLKYIIIINLMPAAVIALGLPLLLFITGGTDQPLNYLLLFISIIAMSIFFSVHSIVLYYLLQPYNVNLESKSATFAIANTVTYIVCYAGMSQKIPTLTFGAAISAFCIIYAIVAFILAYRLAPRTFKLRQ